MHWVLRSLLPNPLRLYKNHQSISKSNSFHHSAKMASASTSATLYAAVTSPAQITGAEPEDAKELKHHLKHGKGFQNPWDSYKNTVGPTTILTIAWYRRYSFNISRPRLILSQAILHWARPMARHNTTDSSCSQTDIPPNP